VDFNKFKSMPETRENREDLSRDIHYSKPHPSDLDRLRSIRNAGHVLSTEDEFLLRTLEAQAIRQQEWRSQQNGKNPQNRDA
jgi:hypothetical protein